MALSWGKRYHCAMNREQLSKVREFVSPSRRALSLRFPALAPAILAARRSFRSVSAALDRSVASERSREYLPCVVTRHSSLLMRKLGSTDMRLQRQKVENLRIAYVNALYDGQQSNALLWSLGGGIFKWLQ